MHCDISFRVQCGALLTVPSHLLCPGLLTAVPYGNSKLDLGNREVTYGVTVRGFSSGFDPSSNPEDFAKATACWPSRPEPLRNRQSTAMITATAMGNQNRFKTNSRSRKTSVKEDCSEVLALRTLTSLDCVRSNMQSCIGRIYLRSYPHSPFFDKRKVESIELAFQVELSKIIVDQMLDLISNMKES